MEYPTGWENFISLKMDLIFLELLVEEYPMEKVDS
jgi:hypothetical protein